MTPDIIKNVGLYKTRRCRTSSGDGLIFARVRSTEHIDNRGFMLITVKYKTNWVLGLYYISTT